jgi:hypothetical protein
MTILLMSAKWSLFLMMPTDALVDEYVNTHSRTRINKTLGEIPKNRIMDLPHRLDAEGRDTKTDPSHEHKPRRNTFETTLIHHSILFICALSIYFSP